MKKLIHRGVGSRGRPATCLASDFLSGPRRLEVDFSAPTFANPTQVPVEYRSEGYGEGWIEAGVKRTAEFTNLSPGAYEFLLRSGNGYGVWNKEPVVVGFTVSPRWWETAWFQVAVVLAVGGWTVGYFSFRTRRIRKANAMPQREIVDRQRAELESRTNLDQLARVSRAASMGELTTSIAHEVKQPLFAIVSNAETARRMLDRKLPDLHEIGDALNDIASDGNRAAGIIDRVRSLVKKENQSNEPLNLVDVASDAIRFAGPEARQWGVVIDTEFATDLPSVSGDAIELQQVILNLLINGAQAMIDLPSDSKTLTVRIWATPNADAGATFHFRLPVCQEAKSCPVPTPWCTSWMMMYRFEKP